MPAKAALSVSSASSSASSLTDINSSNVYDAKPKRRGRPPVKKETEEKQTTPKKRGRKPKGGKIISNTQMNMNNTGTKENIIVHLKCSTASLNKSIVTNSIDGHYNMKNNFNLHDNSNLNTKSNINYFNINKETIKVNTMFEQATKCNNISSSSNSKNNIDIDKCESNDKYKKIHDDDKKRRKRENEIFDKLKELQQNLKHDNVCFTESNCFWCTYSFENPPIHIPKHIIKDVYHVYGCFCSPECATAFLFNENIDNSIRFERYSLLCSLYTKVFKYDKNIKPAPNPHYTLDKFCGNLSIMEYRELFNSNRLLFVINKPVTRDLPELDIVDSNIYN